MEQFPSFEKIRDLIHLAHLEDMGPAGVDVTSRLLVAEDATGVGTIVQREAGVVCGLPLVAMIAGVYDERLRVEQIPGFHMEVIEGRFNDAGRAPLLRVRGPLRSLLAAERVILNFLQHLSGVATHTHRFVRRVEGTRAKIYDTRKTLPGFRQLDKYAVRCGGGNNHREGLFDAVLVKDNHLAQVPLKSLRAFITQIVRVSREEDPRRPIEVEVDSLDQLAQILPIPDIDVILLDNMDCPMMQAAVDLREKSGARVFLEASGGVNLETVRPIASTGVERIAVGAITHSAPALDIAFDIEI